MPIQAQSADGTVHEFPDGTSMDVVDKAMMNYSLTSKSAKKNVGVGEDVAKSAVAGAAKGTTGLLGAPGDMMSLYDKGMQRLVPWLLESTGLMSPEKANELRADTAKLSQVFNKDGTYGGGRGFAIPTSKGIDDAVQSVAGDYHEPQTVPGEYARTAASFVPAALAMGGAGAARDAVFGGIVPGVASEAAGQITKGTELEPYARGAAALGAGVWGNLPYQSKTYASNVLSKATQGMDDAAWAKAEALQNEGRALGVPLTAAEAVQSASGGSTRLSDMQRVLEGSPEGGRVLRPFMAQREGQIDAAGRNAMRDISPTVDDPAAMGLRVQKSAEGGLLDAEKARTAAVDPHYKAAGPVRLNPKDMENVLQQIESMAAEDKTGLIAPKLRMLADTLTETPATAGTPAQRVPKQMPNGTIYQTTPATPGSPRVPITDIENLDRARKAFRTNPEVGLEALPKEEAAKVTGFLDTINQKMLAASPDLRQGRDLYSQISRDVVEPMSAGPMGRIADTNDIMQQGSRLLPDVQGAAIGGDKRIGDTVRTLAVKDPEAAQNLVRQHLETTFNQAMTTGNPEFGGAKFAKWVAGGDQNAKNLEAAVKGLPNGDTRWEGMKRLLAVFEATGERQQIGSQTAFNAQMLKDMSAGKKLGEAGVAAATGGIQLPRKAMDWYQEFRLGKNTEDLARMLTDPKAVPLLRSLAKAQPGSANAQLLAVQLISSNASGAKSIEP